RIDARARFAIAALPVLALGFDPQWIPECTLAEVNSWHVAWLCGTALLLVRIIQSLEAKEPPFSFARSMTAWGIVCGVGGAHHRTAVFFAFAFTGALTWALVRARRFRPATPLLWLG